MKKSFAPLLTLGAIFSLGVWAATDNTNSNANANNKLRIHAKSDEDMTSEDPNSLGAICKPEIEKFCSKIKTSDENALWDCLEKREVRLSKKCQSFNKDFD